jgi:hypothetical protein
MSRKTRKQVGRILANITKMTLEAERGYEGEGLDVGIIHKNWLFSKTHDIFLAVNTTGR